MEKGEIIDWSSRMDLRTSKSRPALVYDYRWNVQSKCTAKTEGSWESLNVTGRQRYHRHMPRLGTDYKLQIRYFHDIIGLHIQLAFSCVWRLPVCFGDICVSRGMMRVTARMHPVHQNLNPSSQYLPAYHNNLQCKLRRGVCVRLS